ncbi:unnamed protein product [Amoebophrya sp. A120]|nr:unnamed protein product [Amoebophrya sp. A120]|eukprot:GSA120T00023548001.1
MGPILREFCSLFLLSLLPQLCSAVRAAAVGRGQGSQSLGAHDAPLPADLRDDLEALPSEDDLDVETEHTDRGDLSLLASATAARASRVSSPRSRSSSPGSTVGVDVVERDEFTLLLHHNAHQKKLSTSTSRRSPPDAGEEAVDTRTAEGPTLREETTSVVQERVAASSTAMSSTSACGPLPPSCGEQRHEADVPAAAPACGPVSPDLTDSMMLDRWNEDKISGNQQQYELLRRLGEMNHRLLSQELELQKLRAGAAVGNQGHDAINTHLTTAVAAESRSGLDLHAAAATSSSHVPPIAPPGSFWPMPMLGGPSGACAAGSSCSFPAGFSPLQGAGADPGQQQSCDSPLNVVQQHDMMCGPVIVYGPFLDPLMHQQEHLVQGLVGKFETEGNSSGASSSSSTWQQQHQQQHNENSVAQGGLDGIGQQPDYMQPWLEATPDVFMSYHTQFNTSAGSATSGKTTKPDRQGTKANKDGQSYEEKFHQLQAAYEEMRQHLARLSESSKAQWDMQKKVEQAAVKTAVGEVCERHKIVEEEFEKQKTQLILNEAKAALALRELKNEANVARQKATQELAHQVKGLKGQVSALARQNEALKREKEDERMKTQARPAEPSDQHSVEKMKGTTGARKEDRSVVLTEVQPELSESGPVVVEDQNGAQGTNNRLDHPIDDGDASNALLLRSFFEDAKRQIVQDLCRNLGPTTETAVGAKDDEDVDDERVHLLQDKRTKGSSSLLNKKSSGRNNRKTSKMDVDGRLQEEQRIAECVEDAFQKIATQAEKLSKTSAGKMLSPSILFGGTSFMTKTSATSSTPSPVAKDLLHEDTVSPASTTAATHSSGSSVASVEVDLVGHPGLQSSSCSRRDSPSMSPSPWGHRRKFSSGSGELMEDRKAPCSPESLVKANKNIDLRSAKMDLELKQDAVPSTVDETQGQADPTTTVQELQKSLAALAIRDDCPGPMGKEPSSDVRSPSSKKQGDNCSPRRNKKDRNKGCDNTTSHSLAAAHVLGDRMQATPSDQREEGAAGEKHSSAPCLSSPEQSQPMDLDEAALVEDSAKNKSTAKTLKQPVSLEQHLQNKGQPQTYCRKVSGESTSSGVGAGGAKMMQNIKSAGSCINIIKGAPSKQCAEQLRDADSAFLDEEIKRAEREAQELENELSSRRWPKNIKLSEFLQRANAELCGVKEDFLLMVCEPVAYFRLCCDEAGSGMARFTPESRDRVVALNNYIFLLAATSVFVNSVADQLGFINGVPVAALICNMPAMIGLQLHAWGMTKRGMPLCGYLSWILGTWTLGYLHYELLERLENDKMIAKAESDEELQYLLAAKETRNCRTAVSTWTLGLHLINSFLCMIFQFPEERELAELERKEREGAGACSAKGDSGADAVPRVSESTSTLAGAPGQVEMTALHQPEGQPQGNNNRSGTMLRRGNGKQGKGNRRK